MTIWHNQYQRLTIPETNPETNKEITFRDIRTTTTPKPEKNVVVVPVQTDDISKNAKKESDTYTVPDTIKKLLCDNFNMTLTEKQVTIFNKLCNGNIDKLIEKVNMLKKQDEVIKPIGWLISALQNDYQESTPYINNNRNNTKKKQSPNSFFNYSSQREWDYETIERLAMQEGAEFLD